MYPDHEDVIRLLKTVPAPKPTPEEIFADVALSRLFVATATHFCHNHGRHEQTNVSDIKALAEKFIGRPLNDVGFTIGLRMTGLEIKRGRYDKISFVKVAPLDRFEEIREQWGQRQAAEQKEIDEEIKKWATFRAAHPNYRP